MDIECVFESMTGKGSIYISNFLAAQNLPLLQSKGISAVLSVARSGLLHHSREDIPHYLYIPAEDHEDYQLHKHFSTTYDFIEAARKDTNVLVHCMVGVSRSATIVIAYLLNKYKYSLSQVMGIIQRRRRKINPNPGFIKQLQRYAIMQGLNPQLQPASSKRDRTTSKSKRTSPSPKLSHKLHLSSEKGNVQFKEKGQDKIQTIIKQQSEEKIHKKCSDKQFESIKCPYVTQEKDQTLTPPQISQINRVITIEEKEQQVPPSEGITLRKGFSCDSKQSNKKSIEQRISKVRQKILKKEQQKAERGSSASPFKDKQNKRSQVMPSRKLEDYLTLYSRKHTVGRPRLQLQPQQQEQSLWGGQIQIDRATLYRQKPAGRLNL